jgi:hypothetical protein
MTALLFSRRTVSMRQKDLTPLDLIARETRCGLAMWTDDRRLSATGGSRAFSFWPMMIRASEPPMKWRRLIGHACALCSIGSSFELRTIGRRLVRLLIGPAQIESPNEKGRRDLSRRPSAMNCRVRRFRSSDPKRRIRCMRSAL